MTDGADTPKLSESTRVAIRSLFADLPADFDERHDALKLIRDEFHTYLARALEPALNQYVRQRPQATLPEKSQTASIINGLVRTLGLTIRDEAGRSSRIVADSESGDHPEISRFRFETRNEHGRVKRTGAKQYVPELTLMPEYIRQEFWARRLQDRPRSQER